MDSSSQDRDLPASERKLQNARRDGQVARSADVSHLAVLGAGAASVMVLVPGVFDHLKTALGQHLLFDAAVLRQPGSMLDRLSDMAFPGLMICLAFATIVAGASVLSSLLVGGWVFSLKPVTPDFSRLSPLKGLSGLVSKKKLIDVVKMTLITAILLAVAAWFFESSLPEVAGWMKQPNAAALSPLADWLTRGMGLLMLVIVALAMFDVPLQTFLYKSELKMSRQEMKDEHKESEGNPQIKQRLRSKQRDMAQRNSIRAVPQADFVVMNPTHFAVAIQYDGESMSAPRVISKGADLLAMKIRDIANAHDVPVLQSPPLARALYAHAELDQEIPSSLYTAVAQVLAYIYRLEAAMKGAGPMPDAQPSPDVPPELDPLTAKSAIAVTP